MIVEDLYMAIINGYCSLSDVKAALRLTDTVDDSLLEISIEAAAREIDGWCERVFYTTNATRVYRPDASNVVQIDDCQSVTTLKTDSDGDGTYNQTWETTDFELSPLNGLVGGLSTPFYAVRATGDYTFNSGAYSEASVQIVGVWGYATVPTAVRQANLLLSMRQFKRYDSPTGVMGFGDMIARVGRVDPDVEKLLAPFKRVLTA
jgi:hypothetical protein